MSKKIRLLIVDDETRFLATLAQRLSLRDFDVSAAASGAAAIELAADKEFDLALVDLKMPGLSGEQVLESFKRNYPDMEIIILTGHGSLDSAVQCARLGSHSYLQKPCETRELLLVLKDAYQRRVQRKLGLSENEMEELLGRSGASTHMDILKRLKELHGE